MNFLCNEVAIWHLLNLEDGMSCSKVRKKGNSTIKTFLTAINNFEEAGLITSKKIGRERILHLTDKGKLVKKEFIILLDGLRMLKPKMYRKGTICSMHAPHSPEMRFVQGLST